MWRDKCKASMFTCIYCVLMGYLMRGVAGLTGKVDENLKRVVLLGNTGVGKSALCNYLSGKGQFTDLILTSDDS